MKVNFIKTHEDAKLPKRNHDDLLKGDAGFDLFAVEQVIIKPNSSKIIPIGLKVGHITPGFWFKIEGRSGLGFKKGLQPHFGIIDNGYRGDLGIKIYNLSGKSQVIEKGQGVAQFIVYRMTRTDVDWMEEPEVLEEGIRGDKGFGSSDQKEGDD